MPTLQQLIDRSKNTTVRNLNLLENRPAGLEIQTRLCDLGILDPEFGGSDATPFGPVRKADGLFGSNSLTAIFEFCRLAGVSYVFDGQVSIDFLQALSTATPETFAPVKFDPLPGDSPSTLLAKRILRRMRARGHWIARSPNMYNIVYVEGMDAAGTSFKDAPNLWNDRRIVIRMQRDGQPEIIHNFDATTEPGFLERAKPHADGLARIAFGQYKSWKYGLHKAKQIALKQSAPIRIYRDKDRNNMRPGDKVLVGIFGINQHSTTERRSTVGDWCAGCLVGREWGEHLAFLNTVKSDVRYALNGNYEFVSAVMPGNELAVV